MHRYIIKVPAVKVKGLLSGRTFMEFVGTASIRCVDTKRKVKLNFNTVPTAENDGANSVRGQYLVGDAVVGAISGVWSQSVDLTMNDTGETQVIMANDDTMRRHVSSKRTVNRSADLLETESSRTWQKAISALNANDDDDAEAALQAVYGGLDPEPNVKYFQSEENSDDGLDTWAYKHLDLRPWSGNDAYTVECEGKISTMTKADCGDFYSSVRDASPLPPTTADGSVLRSRLLSPGNTSASAQSIRRPPMGLLSSALSTADDLCDVPLDARVGALEARIRELEAHNERFTRVYIPLIGLLFAVIQILLPLFGLVLGLPI